MNKKKQAKRGPGRPPKAPADRRNVPVYLLVTHAEAELLDQLRGEMSGGAYAYRCLTGAGWLTPVQQIEDSKHE